MYLYLTLVFHFFSVHGDEHGRSPSATVTEFLQDTTPQRVWDTLTLTSGDKETANWPDDRPQDGITRGTPSGIVTPKNDIVWELITPTSTDSEGTEYPNEISVSTASTNSHRKQSTNNGHEIVKTTRTIPNSYEEFSWNCSAEGQRLCGCTETCLWIENCCQDSEFANTKIDIFREENPAISCYSGFTDKWTLSLSSLLVDKCSKDWTDDQVRDLCEHPNTGDIQSYVPGFSPTTRLSYRNIHCIWCNGLNDYIPWEVTFQSGRPFDFSFMDSFSKMNDLAGRAIRYRGQQFVVSPKAEYEPAHCVPSAIETCKPEVTTDKIRMLLCQSYYSPVIVDGTTYRNIDCFECYTGINRDDVLVQKILRQRDAAMSVILGVFGGQQRSRQSRCHGSTCGPILTHIRGFYKIFTVSTNVTRAHDAGRNMSLVESSAIEDTLSRCALYLQLNVSARLEKYDHVIKMSFGMYDVWDHIPLRLSVKIEDIIPIPAIYSIQRDIVSVKVDLDVTNVIQVSFKLDVTDLEHEDDGDIGTTGTDRSYPAVERNKTGQGNTNAAGRQGGVTVTCLLTVAVISLPIMNFSSG